MVLEVKKCQKLRTLTCRRDRQTGREGQIRRYGMYSAKITYNVIILRAKLHKAKVEFGTEMGLYGTSGRGAVDLATTNTQIWTTNEPSLSVIPRVHLLSYVHERG